LYLVVRLGSGKALTGHETALAPVKVAGWRRIELFRLRSRAKQGAGRHGLPGHRLGLYPVTTSPFPTRSGDKRIYCA